MYRRIKKDFWTRLAVVVVLISLSPSIVRADLYLPTYAFYAMSDESKQSSAKPDLVSSPAASVPSAGNILEPLPKPFQLSRPVSTGSEFPLSTESLHADARKLIDDARKFEASGRPVDAALSYFELMEQFPDSQEAIHGLKQLTRYSELLLRGNFPDPVIRQFEAQLPSWESLTSPESKYILAAYFYYRGQYLRDRNQFEAAREYFTKGYDVSSKYLEEYAEFPGTPLILVVLQYLMGCAKELGPEFHQITAEILHSLAASKPASFTTWSIYFVLGGHYGSSQLRIEQHFAFETMLAQNDPAGINSWLQSADVWPHLKAQVLYSIGRAHMGLGDSKSALAYLNRVCNEFPNEGAVSQLSAVVRANLIEAADLDESAEALLAYQRILDQYPGGSYEAPVKFFMAKIYSRTGNHDYAIETLNEIVVKHPEAKVTPAARQQIEMIRANFWDGGPIDREAWTGFAQVRICGPVALKHLLALGEIQATEKELAALAETNESGTSMLALAHAAALKGMPLNGVHADSFVDLDTPFIAFVNENHFVVVEETGVDFVRVRDMHKTPQRISSTQFMEMWSGDALISAKSVGTAVLLDEPAMAEIIGGEGDLTNLDCPDLIIFGGTCLPGNTDPETHPTCNNPSVSGGASGGAGGGGDCASDPAVGAQLPCQNDAGGAAMRSAEPSLRTEQSGVAPIGTPATTPRPYKPLGTNINGISAPGINLSLGVFNIGQRIDETDLVLKSVGDLELKFTRNFENSQGLERKWYMGEVFGGDSVHAQNIGKNWTHSLNIFLRVSKPPQTGVSPNTFFMVDGSGTATKFSRILTDPGQTAWPDSEGYTNYSAGALRARRHATAEEEFIVYFPNGFRYYFSQDYIDEEQGGISRITRIESPGEQSLTFEYNFANPGGFLTKVTTPEPNQTSRYLSLEYDGYQITKASIKRGPGDSNDELLQYVQYEYNGSQQLTKVTHDGDTDNAIRYFYTTPSTETIYINKIVDRMENEYTFSLGYSGGTATSMTVNAPEGQRTVLTKTGDDVLVQDIKASTSAVLNKAVWRAISSTTRVSDLFFYATPASSSPASSYTYAYGGELSKLTMVQFTDSDGIDDLEGAGTDDGTYIVAEYFYDDWGRLLTKWGGSSASGTTPKWTYAYEPYALYTGFTTPPTLSANMSPTEIVAPDGTKTEITYIDDRDNNGRRKITKIITPAHRIDDPEDPDGVEFDYNGKGELAAVKDPNGVVWDFAYDDEGDLRNITGPDTPFGDRQMHFEHDDFGRVTLITDREDRVTKLEYSPGGSTCGCGTQGNLTKVYRAYGTADMQVTTLDYDANDRLVTIMDAESDVTSFFYDNLNRLTQVTDPAAKSTILSYNELGQVIDVMDAESNLVSYAYDHMSRVTSVTDAVGNTIMDYNAFGNLIEVEDGDGREWKFVPAPTEFFRIKEVKDDGGKEIEYLYDIAGRVTKVSAAGGAKAVNYLYDTGTDGTGMLTKITDQDSGGQTIGDYQYDEFGRLTFVNDLLRDFLYGGATNGAVRYHYDQAGRMTKVTIGNPSSPAGTYLYDYDDTDILTKTTDWNDLETLYEFNDLYQMTNLHALNNSTANKQMWEFQYTDAGRIENIVWPTEVGMNTNYIYDANGTLSKIYHKDGSTVKQGFSYFYDDVYNITRMVQHENLTIWDYTYDQRYRLSTASLRNWVNTIHDNYEYDYDDGDNLITKVEPWADDFSDRDMGDGWTVSASPNAWTATTGAAKASPTTGTASMYVANTDTDITTTFTYSLDHTVWPNLLTVYPRENSNSLYRVQVSFGNGFASLAEVINGSAYVLQHNPSATSTVGQKYKVKIVISGQSIKVHRQPAGGGAWSEILSGTIHSSINSTARVKFTGGTSGSYTIDDVRIVSNSLSRTTTYSPANNNQLTSETAPHTNTISYAYDALGRLSTKTQGSVTKTHTYNRTSQLNGVNSSDSAETDTSYVYFTSDQTRAFRSENGVLKDSYPPDNGFNLSYQTKWNGTGTKLADKYYVPGLAEVDVTGVTPTSGTAIYTYLATDHLGSTSNAYDEARNMIGEWEYSPYGEPFMIAGPPSITRLFTGHEYDHVTGQYHAPFRVYNPKSARWITRDPLGMIDGTNMFGYVGGQPVNYIDPLGLWDRNGKPESLEEALSQIPSVFLGIMKDSGEFVLHCATSVADAVYNSVGPDAGYFRASSGHLWVMAEVDLNLKLRVSGGWQYPPSNGSVAGGLRWNDVLPDNYLTDRGSLTLNVRKGTLGVNGDGDVSVGLTTSTRDVLTYRLRVLGDQ